MILKDLDKGYYNMIKLPYALLMEKKGLQGENHFDFMFLNC